MRLLAFRMDGKLAVYNEEEVEQETIDFLRKWSSIVSDFQSMDSLYRLFILEVAEYRDFISYCKTKDIEELTADSMFRVKLNKYVTNITSNSRLAIEHFEFLIKKDYSEFEQEWQVKKKELHSNNFSYRFFYKLRNCIQHVGFPISKIQQKYKKEDEKEVLDIELIFDPVDLLEKYDSWGDHVKPDLLDMKGKEFTFSSILEDYMRDVGFIYFYSLEAFLNKNNKFIIGTLEKFSEITLRRDAKVFLLDVTQEELRKMKLGNWKSFKANSIISTSDVRKMINTFIDVGLVNVENK